MIVDVTRWLAISSADGTASYRDQSADAYHQSDATGDFPRPLYNAYLKNQIILQANKLPGQPIGDQQQPNSIPVQLDPLQALVQQMHSLQRIQPPVSGIPGIGIPPNMQNENLVNNLSGLHGTLPVPGMAAANLSGLNAPAVIPTPLPPKPPSMDPLANSADNDPINSLLRQLQNKQLQQTQQVLPRLIQSISILKLFIF